LRNLLTITRKTGAVNDSSAEIEKKRGFDEISGKMPNFAIH